MSSAAEVGPLPDPRPRSVLETEIGKLAAFLQGERLRAYRDRHAAEITDFRTKTPETTEALGAVMLGGSFQSLIYGERMPRIM